MLGIYPFKLFFKKSYLITLFITSCVFFKVQAQQPPIPVELFFSDSQVYFEIVISRTFKPNSALGFFSVASFTAPYTNDILQHEFVIPVHIFYSIKNGLGFHGGLTINNFTGYSPLLGPQHVYASKKILTFTKPSISIDKYKTFGYFGVYEFLPSLNKNLSLYTRIQILFNYNLNGSEHARSYLYLRLGLQKKSFVFGLASNLDQYGPERNFSKNFGAFIGWRF